MPEQNFWKGTHKTCSGNAVARGSAKVYAFGGANVVAEENAIIEASGDAIVHAYDNSTIFATDWATIHVRAGSPEIYAKGWSVVRVAPEAKPTVLLDGAAVKIEDATYPPKTTVAVKSANEAAFDNNFAGLQAFTEGREHASHKTTGNPR